MDSTLIPTSQRSTLNPYPGLRPFEFEDRPWFFGRERQEEELLCRLDRSQIVTVIGGSGCGKSSLIRAGLLPQLINHGIPSAGRSWKPVVFVPGKTLDQSEGRSPLHNLTRAFLHTLRPGQDEPPAIDTVIDTFNQIDGFGRLVDVYSDQPKPGHTRSSSNYLFVIDQFEELFSEQVRSSLEARSLVARIEDAWRRPHPRVFIVITMRSEHLNDCAAYPDFPEVINDTSYLVRRLQDSELKDAIEGPVSTFCEHAALLHDLDEIESPQFELDLTELLLREVDAISHDPDHLPLFQHCLFWLWHIAYQDVTTETTLPTMVHRGHLAQALGLRDQEGLSKYAGKILEACLDFRAGDAHARLTEAVQAKAERLFRVLATRDELQTYKRTPLLLSRLNEVDLTQDDYQSIKQGMQEPHPYLRKTVTGEIDIYHEALIRKWGQFRGWINREWERTNLYHQLCNQLIRWQAATAQNRDDRLLTDETGQEATREGFADARMSSLLLEHLYDWEKNPCQVQTPCDLHMAQTDISAFIRTSLDYRREQKRQKETETAAKLARARRRRKQILVSLVVLITLSWMAIFILHSLQRQAASGELAFRSLDALTQDPAQSAHVAVAAVDHDPDYKPAIHALRQAMATLEIAHTDKILLHSAPVTDARFSPDGTHIIVAGGDDVRIYTADNYTRGGSPFHRKGVAQAWLNPDNSALFTLAQNGSSWVAQYELIGSGTARTFACESVDGDDTVISVVSSPDTKYLAAGCKLGRILIWDVQQETTTPTYQFQQQPGNPITALAFDRDSRYIAAGDTLGDVYIWKLGQPQAWIGKGKIKHANAVRAVNFHPTSPNLLVTASDDTKAIVWDLDFEKRRVLLNTDKSPRVWRLSHHRPVISAKFVIRNDGGTPPVVTIVDKIARIWLSERSEEKQARGHDDWVKETNPSPNGEYLVTASADGTARIWSTRTAGTIAILRGHRGEVTHASFSPQGDSVLTASTDRTVRIWRVKLPETLWSSDRWILSARLEPRGSQIAAAGESTQGEGGMAVLLQVPKPGQSLVPSAEPDALQTEPPPRYMVGANLSRLSWSHDHKFLAATQSQQGIYNNSRLIVWDATTRQVIKSQEFEDIALAQFSQGTDTLATVAAVTPVIVWDAQSLNSPDGPQEITRFGQTGDYTCIAISPEDRKSVV